MKEATKESPLDRGQVELQGICQGCGARGRVIAVPGAPPPNEFCARCAIEYGESVVGEAAADDDLQ
jgi:hypothetical protein